MPQRCKKVKSRQYKNKPEAVFLLGSLPKVLVPELNISYTKGKTFLGIIKKAEDVSTFLRKIYPPGQIELQESFIVLYLNHRNQILGYYRHTSGAITATIVDVRIIYGVALKSLATSIILSHNHPSDNLKPSKGDFKITETMKIAGELLDIQVLDHIIITKDSFYSLADNGDM